MKKAFTLSEVLVTLGIIGVVSAMTIPTLMRSHQKQVYVTRLHKVYNIMTEGFALLMQESNAVDLKEAVISQNNTNDGAKLAENFLKSHFKIASDCGKEASKCFSDKYKSISGNETSSSFLKSYGMYAISLADGTSVAMLLDFGDMYGDNSVGQVYVDTNGKEGPNVVGRDFFRMYIFPDGVLDDYMVDVGCRMNGRCHGVSSPEERREDNFNRYCKDPSDSDGCFGKLLNDGWKMNY